MLAVEVGDPMVPWRLDAEIYSFLLLHFDAA